MAYTVVDKSQSKSKAALNKKASKDNFPTKTESAKKLISKVGLPKELKPVKE
jgi:hypothetical protein